MGVTAFPWFPAVARAREPGGDAQSLRMLHVDVGLGARSRWAGAGGAPSVAHLSSVGWRSIRHARPTSVSTVDWRSDKILLAYSHILRRVEVRPRPKDVPIPDPKPTHAGLDAVVRL